MAIGGLGFGETGRKIIVLTSPALQAPHESQGAQPSDGRVSRHTPIGDRGVKTARTHRAVHIRFHARAVSRSVPPALHELYCRERLG